MIRSYFIVIGIVLIIYMGINCSTTKPYYGLTYQKYEYIKHETINGELDVTKNLKNNKIYIIDGKGYASDYMALHMWSKAVKDIGIQNSSDAIALYEKIIESRLDSRQKKAIKSGFNSE